VLEELWRALKAGQIRHQLDYGVFHIPMPVPAGLTRDLVYGYPILVGEIWDLVDPVRGVLEHPLGAPRALEFCEEDAHTHFRNWMHPQGDACPAQVLPEVVYPAIDYIPRRPYLTACEVLCLIAYRRAIPSDLYFAPWGRITEIARNDIRARGEVDAFLHQAIPEPKPAESPMGDAEQTLMAFIHAGRLHPLCKKGDEYEDPLPDLFKYAVVVTARDEVAPDYSQAPRQDQMAAESYIATKSPGRIAFHVSEVRACLELTSGPDGREATPAPLLDVSATAGRPAHHATPDDYHDCIDALHEARKPDEPPLNFPYVWALAPAWLLTQRNALARYKAMRPLFYSERHAAKRRKRGAG
jgi:hypothetical protein